MSTLIDINIPYAGGTIAPDQNEPQYIKQEGKSWCFFGGYK